MCPASGSAPTRSHVGVFVAPCMVTLPMLIRPVPNCSGSDDAAAGCRIPDDDFCGDAGWNRRGRGADVEVTNRRHARHAVVAHHHQRRDRQPAVGASAEAQRAVHGDGVAHGGGVVDRDDMARVDVHDLIRRRDHTARPGRTARPVARCNAAHVVRVGSFVKSGMLCGSVWALATPARSNTTTTVYRPR